MHTEKEDTKKASETQRTVHHTQPITSSSANSFTHDSSFYASATAVYRRTSGGDRQNKQKQGSMMISDLRTYIAVLHRFLYGSTNGIKKKKDGATPCKYRATTDRMSRSKHMGLPHCNNLIHHRVLPHRQTRNAFISWRCCTHFPLHSCFVHYVRT